MNTYHVHRDGQLYTVSSPSLHSALANAEPVPHAGNWEKPESEQTYGLHNEVTREPADAFKVEGPATFAQLVGRDSRQLELVWLLSDNRVQTKRVESIKSHDLLGILVKLVNDYRAEQLTSPKHVGVPRFKSGKNEGKFRFAREHDGAYRRRTVEAAKYNERRERRLADLADSIDAVGAVLALGSKCVDKALPDDIADCAEELARVEYLAEQGPVRARGEIAHYLRERVRKLEHQRELCHCLAAHGMPEGSRVRVLPSPYAVEGEDDCEGSGIVEAVNEPGSRDVFVNGQVWTVPISRLQPAKDLQ